MNVSRRNRTWVLYGYWQLYVYGVRDMGSIYVRVQDYVIITEYYFKPKEGGG